MWWRSTGWQWLSWLLLCAPGVLLAQGAPPSPENAQESRTAKDTAEEPTGPQPPQPEKKQWIDRTQQELHDVVSHSARRLDSMFGDDEDRAAYESAAGSIAPALLWDEFDGFQPKVRFHVNVPLPQLNERVNAFVGRVNRDEYVSERAEPSGAFERQYGPASDEQTLAGITYYTPLKQGSRFDAGAGIRLRLPTDPYVKGSYVYEVGKTETGLLSLRETLFWQNSQRAGFTSRVELERAFGAKWLLRWAGSASISQDSDGVYGYSAIRALRGFSHRRAMALEIGFDGSTDAPVPLHDYGIKVAYRQRVFRDWLILEVRTSLSYPKEEPGQPREPSWGIGAGFEMFFGTDEFLARPVTF